MSAPFSLAQAMSGIADELRLERGCDKCGAPAKREVTVHTGGTKWGDLVLLFCGHHYADHEAKITGDTELYTVKVIA
jgi:hypothetical protein